jgi:hypothetical protein
MLVLITKIMHCCILTKLWRNMLSTSKIIWTCYYAVRQNRFLIHLQRKSFLTAHLLCYCLHASNQMHRFLYRTWSSPTQPWSLPLRRTKTTDSWPDSTSCNIFILYAAYIREYIRDMGSLSLSHEYFNFLKAIIRREARVLTNWTCERQWVEAQVENAKQPILIWLKGQVSSDEAHIHHDLQSLRYKIIVPFMFS